MKCRERLEAYLRDAQVSFEVHPHLAAFTAQAVAEREHIPSQRMVKVVVIIADGEPALLALPTSRRVNLAQLREILDAREVRLAAERELAAMFPDCEIGAMPPFGNLYRMPVYVDRALEAEPEIYVQAGSHTAALSLAYADFKRLVAPTVVEIAGPCRRPPAHAIGNDLKEMGGGW